MLDLDLNVLGKFLLLKKGEPAALSGLEEGCEALLSVYAFLHNVVGLEFILIAGRIAVRGHPCFCSEKLRLRLY